MAPLLVVHLVQHHSFFGDHPLLYDANTALDVILDRVSERCTQGYRVTGLHLRPSDNLNIPNPTSLLPFTAGAITDSTTWASFLEAAAPFIETLVPPLSFSALVEPVANHPARVRQWRLDTAQQINHTSSSTSSVSSILAAANETSQQVTADTTSTTSTPDAGTSGILVTTDAVRSAIPTHQSAPMPAPVKFPSLKPTDRTSLRPTSLQARLARARATSNSGPHGGSPISTRLGPPTPECLICKKPLPDHKAFYACAAEHNSCPNGCQNKKLFKTFNIKDHVARHFRVVGMDLCKNS
ncbi:hypothetical protein V8E55_004377 [Tylopilus felleus]